MRTATYSEPQNLSIRPILRKTLAWPLKISQILGQFPLTQSKDNEFSFRWTSSPMLCVYLNFLITVTLACNYFNNKQWIVENVMGPLTKTENYAGTFVTLFVLFVDKALTIYSVIIRKSIIHFQRTLNTVLQEVLNEVCRPPKFLPPNVIICPLLKGAVIPPYLSYFDMERKNINRIGLILLVSGLEVLFNSSVFHVLGLFKPGTDVFGTLVLIISCVFGVCSIASPKLCYFYYILSIISKLKVGFRILKEMIKEQERKAMEHASGSEEIGEKIETVLEMHSRLEKVVREYNRAFGIQLLSCIIVSLVLIIGNIFLGCVNITFNAWYIILVTIPTTLLPFICFFLACHNASQMTLEAQRTVIRLRNFRLKLRPELEWRIILHYTKVISSPPSICPMGFTSINYSTVFSAVAMIATYIFVLLQFTAGEHEIGSEMEKELSWMLKQAGLLLGNSSGNS